ENWWTRCFVLQVQRSSRDAFALRSTRRQRSLAYVNFPFLRCPPLGCSGASSFIEIKSGGAGRQAPRVDDCTRLHRLHRLTKNFGPGATWSWSNAYGRLPPGGSRFRLDYWIVQFGRNPENVVADPTVPRCSRKLCPERYAATPMLWPIELLPAMTSNQPSPRNFWSLAWIKPPSNQGQCLAMGMWFSEREKNLFAGHLRRDFFILACMSKTLRLPNCDEQALLDQVQVRLVERAELERFKRLLDEHHYLGSLKAVGERLHYVATDAQGQWLALLLFSAPAKHLKHRDQWIGWSAAQRHRRLSLVTNNSRFLILPERSVPNLASKVLRMTLDRLA